MSLQYIQDKDITVCTLGAHQALIKVTSQNSGSVLKPSCKPTLLSTQFHKPI